MPDYTKLNILEMIKDVLGERDHLYLRVGGNRSMHPSLQENDIVEIKKTDIPNIKFGDIIVYRHPSSELVAHRLIKIENKNGRKLFITKADVSNFYDEPIIQTDVLGKVIRIKRDQRHIRLDGNISRIKAIIYTGIIIFRRWFCFTIPWAIREEIRHKILGGILRKVQGFNLYSCIMKRIFGKRITHRLATCKDAPSIARLHRIYCWPTPLEEITNNLCEYLKVDKDKPTYCFLAQIGDKVIGTFSIRKIPNLKSTWRGENVFISWRFRRIGIAEELAKLALEKLIQNGATEIKTGFFKKIFPIFIKIYKRLNLSQYYSLSFVEFDRNNRKKSKQLILITLTKEN